MNEEKQFWMVWREGGNSPTAKHPTADSARSEAERLAERMPNSRFFVMQAIGWAEKMRPVVFHEIDSIPF